MKTLKEYQEIENLVLDLRQQDSRKTYESLKVLKQKSQEDAFVYSFLDDFIQMMEDKNSYFRTRGLQVRSDCGRGSGLCLNLRPGEYDSIGEKGHRRSTAED